MKKTVGGSQYQAECPECGKIIRDLWDIGLQEGNEFCCPHCDSNITIESVDMIAYVTLVSNGSEDSKNEH
jgi:DNA-directed RNA polymerase subunit RPC12/RpoP